ETGSSVVAHTRIDDPQRSAGQQVLRQRLRGHIAVGRQAGLRAPPVPQVVKAGAEVCDIVLVGDRILEAADLGELDRLMEGNLRLRGLEFERRVPGAAVRTVETAAE